MRFLRHPTVFVLFGAIAAFCTYACMYAFRKGITAVTFEGIAFAGISYKIWLITAQVLGYAASKRIGVKVVSEMSPGRRALNILLFIGLSELALLGFALVPAPWNIVFLFLNGLPLGMVYGIMLGFLEGRRQTDAMVAGLTASFIFASGFVKTVALTIRTDWGVSEFWLPFVTGGLFVIPLLISVYGLTLLPPPTAEDRELRTERKPMDADERRAFVRNFGPGLVLLLVSYVLLSAFRDFRDNFGPEILKDAGLSNPGIFAKTETLVAVGVLLVMALLQQVTNNFKAFALLNGIMLLGGMLVGGSTWAYTSGILSPGTWFLLTGLGLYMGYVPCNGLYFERLVASFRYVSTVGFIVTLADYYGYMGSVAVLLYKNFGHASISFLDFFINGAYILAVLYSGLVITSFLYFRKRYQIEVTRLDAQPDHTAPSTLAG
jgi:MFS family permease